MQGCVTVHEAWNVRPRAVAEQPFDRLPSVGPRRLGQCGTQESGQIHIRSGVQEQLHHRQVAAKRGPHEGTPTSTEQEPGLVEGRSGVRIGPVLQQQAHGHGIAPRSRGHQGGGPEPVCRPDIGAPSQQQADDPARRRPTRSEHQRCVARRGGHVHLGAMCQQDLDFPQVAGRAHEGRRSGRIGGLDIGAALQQELEHRGVGVERGQVEGGVALGIAGTHRRATVEGRPDRAEVAGAEAIAPLLRKRHGIFGVRGKESATAANQRQQGEKQQRGWDGWSRGLCFHGSIRVG